MKNKGYTLIEIIISLLILSIIMCSVLLVINNIRKLDDMGKERYNASNISQLYLNKAIKNINRSDEIYFEEDQFKIHIMYSSFNNALYNEIGGIIKININIISKESGEVYKYVYLY